MVPNSIRTIFRWTSVVILHHELLETNWTATFVFLLSLIALSHHFGNVVFVKHCYANNVHRIEHRLRGWPGINTTTQTPQTNMGHSVPTKLTLFVHQPHEQQPGDEANRAPQHQHGNIRLGETKRSDGRVLDGTPKVPHHPLHEAQQGKQTQHQPSSPVHTAVDWLAVGRRLSWR